MGKLTETTSGVTVGHVAVFSDVHGNIKDGGPAPSGSPTTLPFTSITGVATPAQLPVATTAALGAVKPDGTTITISGGVISAAGGGGGGSGALQQIRAQTNAVTTSTAEFVNNDTIPPQTGGTNLLNCTITPTNAASILEIDFVICLAAHAATRLCIALFQDNTSNAFYAATQTAADTDASYMITGKFFMTAGTTSATTIHLRYGNSDNATTVTVNAINGARAYGGTVYSSMTVTEWAA